MITLVKRKPSGVRPRLTPRQWIHVLRFRWKLRLVGEMAALWATTTGLEDEWIED